MTVKSARNRRGAARAFEHAIRHAPEKPPPEKAKAPVGAAGAAAGAVSPNEKVVDAAGAAASLPDDDSLGSKLKAPAADEEDEVSPNEKAAGAEAAAAPGSAAGFNPAP